MEQDAEIRVLKRCYSESKTEESESIGQRKFRKMNRLEKNILQETDLERKGLLTN